VYQASDAYLKQGLPPDMGLAYGRIMVRGWSATASGDYATSVEFRNRITGYTFTHQLSSSGEFHWVLHAGSYEITDVWSGFDRVSQQEKNRGIHFNVPAGRVTYLGDLLIVLPSSYANGAVELFDNFDAATRHLHYHYPSLKLEESPEKELFSTLKSRN
jgi:hypothetical protein